MELLDLAIQRPVVITLAIVGAAVATLGSVLLRKGSRLDPKTARLILRLGYGISGASIAIFIAAGFLGK